MITDIVWTSNDGVVFVGQSYKVEKPEGSRYWFAYHAGSKLPLIKEAVVPEVAKRACVEHLSKSPK